MVSTMMRPLSRFELRELVRVGAERLGQRAEVAGASRARTGRQRCSNAARGIDRGGHVGLVAARHGCPHRRSTGRRSRGSPPTGRAPAGRRSRSRTRREHPCVHRRRGRPATLRAGHSGVAGSHVSRVTPAATSSNAARTSNPGRSESIAPAKEPISLQSSCSASCTSTTVWRRELGRERMVVHDPRRDRAAPAERCPGEVERRAAIADRRGGQRHAPHVAHRWRSSSWRARRSHHGRESRSGRAGVGSARPRQFRFSTSAEVAPITYPPCPVESATGAGHLALAAVAPQLVHRLREVVEPVHVPLRQVATMRVHGQGAGHRSSSRPDERAGVALGTEAVVLEGDEHERREGVVELSDVDVGGAETRLRPQATTCGGRSARAEIGPAVREQRVARPPARGGDGHRPVDQVARVGGGDHHGNGRVGLEAAVVQPQRFDDPARREVVVDRERRTHQRALVALCVPALGDRDRAEVLRGGAVRVHVFARDHRESPAGSRSHTAPGTGTRAGRAAVVLCHPCGTLSAG